MKYGLADRYADKDADMGAAATMLKDANNQLAAQLAARASLQAQMRALVKPHPPDAKAREENAVNPIMKLFERSN